MSDSLQTGKFYGATQRRFEQGGVVLTEVAHAYGRKLPRHTHESAYFSLLLAGSYAEKCAHRAAEYDPFTMGFHPPALTHSDEVGACGSRMFCIELRETYLNRTRPLLTAPRFVPDLCGSEVTWLGLRLYRSFASETLDALQLEEACGDMLERVTGPHMGEEKSRPAWLDRAFELLHESYREALTLEEIAAQIGVHPIHLSRVFRKHYGCTMGEFMNRLRVQYACRALASGWSDLATLAGDVGFADQSHLGRVFKSCTGQTPGKFRSFFHSQLYPF
ncbi:MAG TPA: AraC family transcriptional regulator [Candidatus Acidoferrum sp.]|jgi:AraC family transcriptional regulator